MKKKFLVLSFTIIALGLLLVGCNAKSNPEDAYWAYWNACTDGDFTTAEKYLTEDARERSQALGICGFTHDAINTVEATQGNPPRGFSEEPELVLGEEGATMTWFDDTGNLAMVSIVEIDGEWKITDALWSK